MRKEIGGQCYVHVFSILVILMELWDLTLCLFCSTDAPSAGGMKEQSRTLPAQTFIEEDGERIARREQLLWLLWLKAIYLGGPMMKNRERELFMEEIFFVVLKDIHILEDWFIYTVGAVQYILL